MNTLEDVAFGSDPGRWPLPAATTPRQLWLRAVSAGGQGRYACGLADLEALVRSYPDGRLTSLAFSTRASFTRQLGGHDAARGWDGRAWAVAGVDPHAATDALIGLAADALGVGRFAASRRLLRRADELLGRCVGPRLPIRLAWVSAELAMASGYGPAAVEHAERAVALTSDFGSMRHVVKSQVVLAAARCSVGDVEESRRLAVAALMESDRHGLIPLSWALTCILADIGSAVHSPAQIQAVRDGFADTVRSRGGTWSAR